MNQLTVPIHDEPHHIVVRKALAKKLGLKAEDFSRLEIIKKSLDARRKSSIKFHYKVDFDLRDLDSKTHTKKAHTLQSLLKKHSDLVAAPAKTAASPLEDIGRVDKPRHKPVIIGSGPAGSFCALVLQLAGQEAIVIERGEAVERRLRTVQTLRRGRGFNPESHYCYGEGGAGTFSDGKLTCGRNHPLIRYIFDEFVRHGAPEDILFEAHPHIGTDYLIKIAQNMRKHLINHGTTYQFNKKFVGFRSGGKDARYLVEFEDGDVLPTDHLILAMGHSARETYSKLYDLGVAMQAKPFAIGVRLEHPQSQINQIQYGSCEILPSAEYKLTAQVADRGIWTFCMCPGGHLLPTMAEPGKLAINGMSYHARNSGFANAAIVTNIRREDYFRGHALDGMKFQSDLESKAFEFGGGGYHAPAQRLADFLKSRPSRGDAKSTYKPGIQWARMDKLLPGYAVDGLKHAMQDFDKRMTGFISSEALIVGLESKTSAPVSFPRDETLQSLSHPGLFPCGEGCGFAGGIISAALDGVKVGRALIESMRVQ